MIKVKLLPTRKSSEEISYSGNKTILLVEDEQAILEMTKSILERLGHKVLTASRPTKAIQISQEHKDIQLLITDVVMPEMNGKDLAENNIKNASGTEMPIHVRLYCERNRTSWDIG